VIDDFGMRKLPLIPAEDLLEIVMRCYECANKLLTSNRPVDDWGKLLGDTASVSSMLDHQRARVSRGEDQYHQAHWEALRD
jgi:DNA replication protein DnaC